MGKLNKELLSVVVISVLLALFYLLKVYSPFKKDAVNKNLFKFTSNDVYEINIESKDKKIILSRNGQKWYQKDKQMLFPVDNSRVKEIISSMLSFDKENLVSRNQKNYAQFDVNNNKIVLYDKSHKILAKIYIGKTFGLNSNYIRVGKDVFIVNDVPDIASISDLKDLNPHLINSEDKISKVQIKLPNENISLTKNNKGWYLNGKEVKQERVDFFLNTLKTLKASDILKRVKITPQIKILVVENNKTKTLILQKKRENNINYYLANTDINSNFTYKINGVYLSDILKGKDYFNNPKPSQE